MISYSGLLSKLNEKGLTKTDLTTELHISSRTVAKIGRGEKIADHVLKKIACYLECSAKELFRVTQSGDDSLIDICSLTGNK